MSQLLNKLISMGIITIYVWRGRCAVFIIPVKKQVCIWILKNDIIIAICQYKLYAKITLIYLIDTSQQCYDR